MVIKSPFKDYWDYLQGVYGRDEKIVYERVCASVWQEEGKTVFKKSGLYKPDYELHDNYRCHILAICGKIYVSFYFAGKFYFFQELKGGDFSTYMFMKNVYKGDKLNPNEQMVRDILNRMQRTPSNKQPYEINDRKNRFLSDVSYISKQGWTTDINEKLNCPVCLVRGSIYGRVGEAEYINVRLSDFGIGQIISPNDMYIMISNFLTREKKIVDNRTDVQKIESHGFDKKTSFRKIK